MEELMDYLNNLEPGPVKETTRLEHLLADAWDDLGGDEAGMVGHKLIGRMENIEWQPPVLTFMIERHGGTVLGSTRAELQRWTVDLDRKTATCDHTVQRQSSPMAEKVDVGSMAEELAQKIVDGVADDRLRWLEDGRVRVEAARSFPAQSGYKQTVQGRRLRFRARLIERLRATGWVHVRRNTFERTTRYEAEMLSLKPGDRDRSAAP
jgi:hypothetical protein